MNDTNDLILSVTRIINAPRDVVWRCWTEPELLKQWHVPKPWRLDGVDMDVRPGGRFNTVFAGPDGERMENIGCFIDVMPGQRLVFTDGYAEGFMPRPDSFMTGVVELSDTDDGDTLMMWSARHPNQETKEQHLEMGFEAGWNAAVDQLDELVISLKKIENTPSMYRPLNRGSFDDMTDDRYRIHALCERLGQAHFSKDAESIVDCYTADAVIYSLAPPLKETIDRAGTKAWLETWNGPILMDMKDFNLVVGDSLAWSTALHRIRGEKIDGTKEDLWFRTTMCFRKAGDGWRIVHDHSSVPFYMDGSLKAAVDLQP